MIKKHKYKSGIENYLSEIPYIDKSELSEDYFRLFDVPQKLYAGKNSFRIRANKDTLVRGSTIFIDVVDFNGNPIYHEIADYKGSDNARLIIVYIYDDTPTGPAKIYLAGRRRKDPRTGQEFPYSNSTQSPDYLNNPNVAWIGDVVVDNKKQNNDEIVYLKNPKVTYKEKFASYQKIGSGQDRLVRESGSVNSSVSLDSSNISSRFSNTSRYNTSYDEDVETVSLDPDTNLDDSKTSQVVSVSSHGELPVLSSENFDFKEDMIGGKIVVKGLDEEYSTYILSIIDRNNVEVSDLYYYDAGGSVEHGFKNATNFTASYWTSDVAMQTFASESFLELTIDDLEPAAGVTDQISISYKPYGTFGEFEKINSVQLSEQNVLVDSSSFQTSKSQVVEKQIGDLKNDAEYGNYWNFEDNSIIPVSMSVSTPKTFERGFYVSYSSTESVTVKDSDYLSLFKVKDNFDITAKSGTEYKLQFSSRYTQTGSISSLEEPKYKQIDVYISGSYNIGTDKVNLPHMRSPLKNDEFGTYIGSVGTSLGNTQLNNKLYFKTNDTGSFVPVFVIRNGNGWEFKNISLSPRNEKGYSPNTAKMVVPVNSFKKNNELVLKLEYENSDGKKSGRTSELYGLYFSGSNAQLTEIISSSVFISSSASDLQQVTDKGNTTTNDIEVDGLYVGSRGKSFSTFLGVTAGENSTVQRQTAVGRRAGQSAQGNFNTAFGENSSFFSDGDDVTSVGYASALINSGDHLTAMGVNAGRNNSADSSSFFGYSVGYSGSGNPHSNVQIFGYDIYADKSNQVKLGSVGTELFTVGQLDIEVSQSISDGDILTYDSTRGLALFKSASSLTATTASYVDWPNIDNVPNLLSGSAQDNEVLFWSGGNLSGSQEFTYENETLKVSSSMEVHGDGTKDIFKAKKNNGTFVRINSDGVMVFEEFTTTPPSAQGGLMYSGSEFYVGL